MSRRYVNQLAHQEAFEEVYLAANKQLRPNRNGNLYLQVELSDRTGTVSARMWNAGESVYRTFGDGDYIRVEGTAQIYQGAMQVIATRITKIDPAEVDHTDFVAQTDQQIATLLDELTGILGTMEDAGLRQLAGCFLTDEALVEKLRQAPAGVKHHHAYAGGLLEHIVGLMRVCQAVAPLYPQINRDLLLMGAFLHDLCKVDELTYQHGLGYSDEGQLIGHLVMAVGLLERKLDQLRAEGGPPVSEETALRLKHMIVSHHGQEDFGSPKVPMTLEALALHYLDSLDAKVHAFDQLIQGDPNADSPWTVYHPSLGRKLFKGYPKRPADDAGSAEAASTDASTPADEEQSAE